MSIQAKTAPTGQGGQPALVWARNRLRNLAPLATLLILVFALAVPILPAGGFVPFTQDPLKVSYDNEPVEARRLRRENTWTPATWDRG